MTSGISDERLCALVDGELSTADADALLEQVRADASLRERVSRLQLTKQAVRHAYAGVAATRPARASGWRAGAWRGAAAIVVFTAGSLLGWMSHEGYRRSADGLLPDAGPAAYPASTASDHVLVHLSVAAPGYAQAALERAEGILEAARGSGRTVSVEIVANGGGLDLLREGVSAHADRIARLRAAYPSLALVACGQTAQRLRESGTEVRLLPGTIEASSALDEIVRRMQQGWAYVRI